MSKKLKLFTCRGSPPCAAVLSILAALELPFEEVVLNFMAGEHKTPEHDKRNPQKEIPVLEDDGFFLSESIAIMQYLCENYGGEKGLALYPMEPKQQRAIVNHRLMFNLGSFYSGVGTATFGPVFGLPGIPEVDNAKCVKVLTIFETILSRQGTKFAAGDELTIADISLMQGAVCLYASGYDMSPYPNIVKWYDAVCHDYPKVWAPLKECKDDLSHYFHNRPGKEELDKFLEVKGLKH